MGFWETVKREARKGMEEGWVLAKRGAEVAKIQAEEAWKKGSVVAREKASEMAEIGRLRVQIYLAHQKAQRNFTEIGGKVYDLLKSGVAKPLEAAPVRKLLADTAKLERQVAKLEKQAAAVGKKGRTGKPALPRKT
ncbi:MAG: hypothetical protein HZA23_00025 [Nitrospirae bacterium]|nr:hypothetical protein [Nitrospirota bacterium]